MKKRKFAKEIACLLLEERNLTLAVKGLIKLASPLLSLQSVQIDSKVGKASKTIVSVGKEAKHQLEIPLTRGKKSIGSMLLSSNDKGLKKKKSRELFDSVACFFAAVLNAPVEEKPAPQKATRKIMSKTAGELMTLDELNKLHIEMVLAQCEGKIHGAGGAAEVLGLNGNTLRNRMDKLGVSYKKNDYPKKRKR